MKSFGLTRWAAAGVVAAGLCGTAAVAQPPDPISAAKARQQVADQKAEADVLAAVRDADRLARTNPARAAQILRAAQGGVDLSAAISGDTRKALTALLQAKIAAVEGKAAPAPGAKADPAGAAAKADQQAAFDAMKAEIKEVREGVDTVAKLQSANKMADADRVIAALTARYPNNPAVIGLVQKDGFGRNVAESQALAKMQGDRYLLALNDVTRSSIPPKGDIEFPANWKERTKNRTNEVKLTAKEKALIEALDKPVTLSLKDQPLDYVLQELSTQMGQELVIDTRSVADLMVDLKKPTSLESRALSARTVLRQALGSQGLTFVVKDQTIQVVTVERARDMLVTRVYYLGDLVQGVGPFGGAALTWGPLVDYQQTMANVKLIMDSVQSSVDPLSWKDKGGPGTITFHFPSMSLIVRASSEVHATLGSKLGGGR
jgi:hypothetical protein